MSSQWKDLFPRNKERYLQSLCILPGYISICKRLIAALTHIVVASSYPDLQKFQTIGLCEILDGTFTGHWHGTMSFFFTCACFNSTQKYKSIRPNTSPHSNPGIASCVNRQDSLVPLLMNGCILWWNKLRIIYAHSLLKSCKRQWLSSKISAIQ